MGRGKKSKASQAPRSPKDKSSAPQSSERLTFSRALSNFKRRNAEKALLMMDKEAVELFAKKRIPSLVASPEEWEKLLKKF